MIVPPSTPTHRSRRIPRFIRSFHHLIFGEEISLSERVFIRNLSFSTLGYAVANGLLFIFTVAAGRLVGPTIFGQYALVTALSQILIIPMLLGIDVATMREVARSHQQPPLIPRIVASGTVMTLLLTVITGAIVLFGSPWAATITAVDQSVLVLATFLAAATASRNFLDGIVRGQHQFKLQALVRIADASLVLGVFSLAYWFLPALGYPPLIAAPVAGALLASLLMLALWVKRIRVQNVDPEIMRRLWRYGRYGIFGAIGGILLASVDKVMIERQLSAFALGNYQAYYFASIQFSGQLAYIFLNVFFPTVSQHKQIVHITKKLNHLLRLISFPFIGGLCLFIYITLRFFSRQYTINGWLILAMALYATLWFIFTIYWWLIASTGAAGARYVAYNGLAAGLIYLGSAFFLLPHLELFAPPAAFALAFLYIAAAILHWYRQHAITNS